MPSPKKKIAFLFPGQGAVPETPCSDFLETSIAATYKKFATPQTPSLQNFHQPAIESDESAQLGVFNLTLAMGLEALNHCRPDMITGYSSGLYAAMVAAGCLRHTQGSDAIKLAYRGVKCANKATMMAGVIGLSFLEMQKILKTLPSQGHLSLVNNKSQVIVSIAKTDLASFGAQCLEAGGLKIIPLPFTYPYHVPDLAPTSAKLATYFDSLDLPPLLIPMVAGSSPEYINHNSNRVGRLVADQLHETVWWYKTIQCLIDHDADILVVFDPTQTLTRIIRWISRRIKTIGICNLNDFKRLQDLT